MKIFFWLNSYSLKQKWHLPSKEALEGHRFCLHRRPSCLAESVTYCGNQWPSEKNKQCCAAKWWSQLRNRDLSNELPSSYRDQIMLSYAIKINHILRCDFTWDTNLNDQTTKISVLFLTYMNVIIFCLQQTEV